MGNGPNNGSCMKQFVIAEEAGYQVWTLGHVYNAPQGLTNAHNKEERHHS